MIEVNPYGHVTWAKYEPVEGDAFVAYHLYRLNPRTGLVERIAVITDIETTSYTDHRSWPGSNTYWLSVVVGVSGALIESDRISVTGTLAFPGLWVHETPDPSEAAHLLASSVDMPRRQSQEWRLAAGRREETAFVGPLLSRDIALQLIPEVLDDAEMMEALDRFLDRAYTHGRVLCLRWGGRAGARWFVKIAGGFGEGLATRLSRGQVTFRQHAYEETV